MHPFAYATSQRARLPTQPDIRQPATKIANDSLQSVCVYVDSSESVVDALSELALLSIVISYIDSLTFSLSQQACVFM